MADESNMNMAPITIAQFTNEIRMDIEDGNYEPAIGLGPSGIGKTMSLCELAHDMGIGYRELRLVTMTETDLLGIPDIIVDAYGNKHTTFACNDALPRVDRDGESGILVLDEITSCTSTIRAAAYQLLDSKRALGNYKLPDKWKVVALGNGLEDGGVFNGMEGAFLTRGNNTFRVISDADTWIEWAVKHDVNPSIIAFIKWKRDAMHQLDPDKGVQLFPCQRSWTALATKLTNREKRLADKLHGKLVKEDVELYAAGTVGAEMAPQFAAFYEYKSQIISPDDILNGVVKDIDKKKLPPEALFLTLQNLGKLMGEVLRDGYVPSASTKEERFTTECKEKIANVMRWAMKGNLDEVLIIFAELRKATNLFQLLILESDFDDYCPEFLEYAAKNQRIFNPNVSTDSLTVIAH